MTDSTTPLKRCSNCKTEYPATTEHFHKDARKKDGLRHRCKTCELERARLFRESNRDKVRETDRRYYAVHREEVCAKKRHYRKANPDKIRTINHRYRQIHPDKLREMRRVWADSNRSRLRAMYRRAYTKNRARILERNRRWRKSNPERGREKTARRRARERNAPGSHTASDIRAQYNNQRGRCYYCNKLVGDIYHVDHVVPLERGGSNYPSNIVIACPTCNMEKHNKLPHEWPGGGKLL